MTSSWFFAIEANYLIQSASSFALRKVMTSPGVVKNLDGFPRNHRQRSRQMRFTGPNIPEKNQILSMLQEIQIRQLLTSIISGERNRCEVIPVQCFYSRQLRRPLEPGPA